MGGTAISLVSFPQVLMEPELAIVVIETGKVQKEIQKSTMARTQQLAAKKKKAAKKKSAKKKPAKKKKVSPALGAIVGKPGGSRIDAVKGVWAYIKKNKLNKGRNISADAKLKGVFGGGSMFKLAGAL